MNAENKIIAQLKQKANRLPTTPGVYIMKDSHGKIIYIGKAKALKNRVTQYFGNGNNHTEKVRKMVENVHCFEYILCDSEFEALILENSLIKQNQPKYNILLKDDKGYHYIKITGEKWRKITTSMQTDDKSAEYIGPYYSGYVVKDTVDQVRKIFRLPNCNRSFDKQTKPCLSYHIGLCDAPCKANISIKEYNETVDSAVDFIKHGGGENMIKLLNAKMETAAENLDFEYAAKLRDRINAIKKLGERQKVVMCTYPAQDVFAVASVGETVCVSVFVFRNSKLTDKKHYIIEGFKDIAEFYSEFLQQYYSQNTDIPPRILLDTSSSNDQLLMQWLNDMGKKKVSVIVPKRGEQKNLIDMCRKNAADNLAQNQQIESKQMSAINELGILLGLESAPRIIESYDISHTAGDETVAGMVVFRDGKPYKRNYRHFKVKGFAADDVHSMQQIVDRRFNEYKKAEDEGFSTLPDLILLDGGIGQISAVVPILEKHNIKIPIFGMVKDSKHKTRAIASCGGDIAIKSNKTAFKLVTEIQNEVHRFAISYHKKKRSQKMLSSELTQIDGIGTAKAQDLLKHFKTMYAIKNATVEQLCEVKGISRNLANNIHNKFKTDLK